MATEYEVVRQSNGDSESNAVYKQHSAQPTPACSHVNNSSGPLSLLRLSAVDIASYLFMIIAMVLVMKLKLLSALLTGLLVHQIIRQIFPLLENYLPSQRARLLAVISFSCTAVAVLTGISMSIIYHLKKNISGIQVIFEKIIQRFEHEHARIPAWLLTYIPNNAAEIEAKITALLHSHAPQIRAGGKTVIHSIAHVLLGIILGAVVTISAKHCSKRAPLAAALATRISRFAEAFQRIVFAQVKISAVNTLLTSIYLLIALPIFHFQLPLSKTLVIFTFVVGLLPVIGNLVSNTIIVTISLASGIGVAISSLAFLIIIHKMEYLLNARIVGSEIDAQAWEPIIAMVVMEAAFGLLGIIAAPIFYAYIKRELTLSKLI
ncbi:AI-2E family transporter [Candidatus Vallotia cooleyia]|uniref:AI-2E family transporter n=1 Tax=Candidatus Vallotiella adelgis TaxID=1177211 RepID=UPI001D029EEA|nr:AI-2E family transporter [Candidatus Vallotia cooleyia]UDG82515.1 AI-2E family transporter [Candidatus Vallotia cooleyia]